MAWTKRGGNSVVGSADKQWAAEVAWVAPNRKQQRSHCHIYHLTPLVTVNSERCTAHYLFPPPSSAFFVSPPTAASTCFVAASLAYQHAVYLTPHNVLPYLAPTTFTSPHLTSSHHAAIRVERQTHKPSQRLLLVAARWEHLSFRECSNIRQSHPFPALVPFCSPIVQLQPTSSPIRSHQHHPVVLC